MKRINTYLLALIVMLGFFLRIYDISNTPVSLSHDEVAIGYNAWSILKTGNDEYGNAFPVLFRSFDDYKLPGYIYITVLSEAIFGLNAFAVRFPSVFFGTLTIVFFFLVLRLFVSQMNDVEKKKFGSLPLFGALLLSISPWHINFSRQAFEANLSLFFIVIAIFFMLRMQKKMWNFIPSVIFSVIAVYTYYTARILLPVLLLFNCFVLWQKVRKEWKLMVIGIIFGIIILSPIVFPMFSSGLARINQVSIFNDKAITNEYTQAIVRNNNSLWAKIMFNRRMGYFQEFSDNYFKNLSSDFYFTNGTKSMGLLYVWEAPFFILGLYVLVRLKTQSKWIFIVWFLTVPLVGGFSVQQPNPLRTLANAPLPALFTSMGLLWVFSFKNKFIQNQLFKIAVIFIVLFFFARFLALYFRYEFVLNADRFGDGNMQMAQYVLSQKNLYDTIYITGERWRPYMHLLFYWKYDPLTYQKKGSREGFENVRFGIASWDAGGGIRMASDDLSKLVRGKTLFLLTQSDLATQKILAEQKEYEIDVKESINGRFIQNAFYAVEIK